MWSTVVVPKKRFLTSTSRYLNSGFSGSHALLLNRELVVPVVQDPDIAIGSTQRLCSLRWMNLASLRF